MNQQGVRLGLFIYLLYYALQRLEAYCVRSGLDVSNFRHQASQRVSPPSGGMWNCEQEIFGTFCLNVDFHVTFRDLLHAVKLGHGPDGFTSPQKEGVLRISSP